MSGGGPGQARAALDAAAPTIAAPGSMTVRASLVRRAFFPSPLEEAPGPARTDAFARLRGVFTAVAIFFDLGIYLTYRGSPHFDSDMLAAFAWINISLLAVSATLCFTALRRRGRWFAPLSVVSMTIELFTSVVWIQLTGTVSSYFLLVIPVLILAYRLYGEYWLGLTSYIVGAVIYFGAVVLEETGVLQPAALFNADPGGIYADPTFRISAAISIQFMFLAIFMLANLVARALREKETELDVAQRNLDRVLGEVQPGRLSGHTLDGKYRLGELLGRGGMGEVYQAVRIHDGSELALKVLYAHLCGDEDLARFRREAAVTSKLPPDHVAQIHELGRCSNAGHHYLAMELLHGEDLGMLLRRRGRLTSAELLPIVDQLARGLEAAHAAGVVHRDLKPQNVFLVGAGDTIRVKLLDFGVARLVEGSELTHSAMLIGSPGYLAPEQAVSELGEVGPRADVFALGTIIYRAVTGQSAFAARTPAAAVYEAVHVEPPPPSTLAPELPTDIDLVIALALAKRPAQRYASPMELARDLRAAFTGGLSEQSRDRASAIERRRSSTGLAPTIASTA